MKKPCPKWLKCTKHRKKEPWCLHCRLYTHKPYDPFMFPILAERTSLKDLYRK